MHHLIPAWSTAEKCQHARLLGYHVPRLYVSSTPLLFVRGDEWGGLNWLSTRPRRKEDPRCLTRPKPPITDSHLTDQAGVSKVDPGQAPGRSRETMAQIPAFSRRQQTCSSSHLTVLTTCFMKPKLPHFPMCMPSVSIAIIYTRVRIVLTVK